MERESFIFYRSFYEAVDGLPIENQAHIYKAISCYALNGDQIELDVWETAVFKTIKSQIDANIKRYENGCKGGAPKGNKNARKQPKNNQNQPNDNDNDNDNVNVNVNDNANAASNAPAHAREDSAKEKFFSEFPSVQLNGADDSGVDYTKLLEAFQAGNDYLRNTKSMNYITAHYSEIIGGGYRKAAAAATSAPTKANAIQLWTELLQAIGRAKELRYDSYTGYEVYLHCKRDAESKKEVEAIYEAIPPEVRQIYDKDGFIFLCKMDDEELKFERARFLKLF